MSIQEKKKSSKIHRTFKNEVEVINQYLLDSIYTYTENDLTEEEKSRRRLEKTFTHKSTNFYDTKFFVKRQSLDECTREVVSGTLFNALLYNRSPKYRFMENIVPPSRENYLSKSNLLKNFVTLDEFMYKHSDSKLEYIIDEKLSNEQGREELAMYVAIMFARVEDFVHRLHQIKFYRQEKGKEFLLEGLLSELEKKCENTLTATELPTITQFINKSVIQMIRPYFGKTQYESDIQSIYNRYDKEYLKEGLQEEVWAQVQEKFNKSIENYLILKETVIKHANNELKKVKGIEKVIASMLLLNYQDMHACNIGIINGDDELVFAKIDMTASSFDQVNSDYLQEFMYLTHPRTSSSLREVRYDIDYEKLKEEIYKIHRLFTRDYIESLIYRSLTYKMPLIKTQDDVSIVERLVDIVLKRLEKLKEFADSEEFKSLPTLIKSEYKQNPYSHVFSGEVLKKLEQVIKNNMKSTSTTVSSINVIKSQGKSVIHNKSIDLISDVNNVTKNHSYKADIRSNNLEKVNIVQDDQMNNNKPVENEGKISPTINSDSNSASSNSLNSNKIHKYQDGDSISNKFVEKNIENREKTDVELAHSYTNVSSNQSLLDSAEAVFVKDTSEVEYSKLNEVNQDNSNIPSDFEQFPNEIDQSTINSDSNSASSNSPDSDKICEYQAKSKTSDISADKSKYACVIGSSAVIGLAIGMTIATLTTGLPLFVFGVVGVLVGAMIGYGIAELYKKVGGEKSKNQDIKTLVTNILVDEYFKEKSIKNKGM